MQTAVLEPGKVREADQQKRGGGRKPAANSACGPQNERAFLHRLRQRSLQGERWQLLDSFRPLLDLAGLDRDLMNS